MAHEAVEPFVTTLVDPPWPYADRLNGKNRGAVNHYPTMTIEVIKALYTPSRSLHGKPMLPATLAGHPLADNGHLWLCVTNAFMVEAHEIAAYWGYDVKTILTWCKPQIGMGHYLRNATEHVLFGVRGKCKMLVNNQPSYFIAPRGKHSEKPEELYEIIERCSPGPRLEMFARKERRGWMAWGNEVGDRTGAPFVQPDEPRLAFEPPTIADPGIEWPAP